MQEFIEVVEHFFNSPGTGLSLLNTVDKWKIFVANTILKIKIQMLIDDDNKILFVLPNESIYNVVLNVIDNTMSIKLDIEINGLEPCLKALYDFYLSERSNITSKRSDYFYKHYDDIYNYRWGCGTFIKFKKVWLDRQFYTDRHSNTVILESVENDDKITVKSKEDNEIVIKIKTTKPEQYCSEYMQNILNNL